ncbi:hypothetical protein D3C80_1300380 [compost metagenome]
MQRCALVEQGAGLLQGAYRVVGILRAIAAGKQFFQCRVAFGAADQRGHFGIQCVARAGVSTAEREHHQAQGAAKEAIGEVVEQPVQRFFGLPEAFFQGPAQQRLQVFR